MTCEHADGIASAYFDGELDAVRAFEFETHLKACSDCRAALDRYHELRARIQTESLYFRAPERLERQIRNRLRAVHTQKNKERPFKPNVSPRLLFALGAVAALVVISSISIALLRRSSNTELLAQQVVSSHIRSLMANHLTDVASSDQHTVKPWFTGKVDFSPLVKELAPIGFPLTGGRLDYLDGHPVAALVYGRRKHIINLFIWPGTETDAGVRETALKGYNAMYWTRSHMTYWAVSDLNAQELETFVRDYQQ